jgi:hypothetical protein
MIPMQKAIELAKATAKTPERLSEEEWKAWVGTFLKLREVFNDAHGREPNDYAELERWGLSRQGEAALAYDTDKDGKIVWSDLTVEEE